MEAFKRVKANQERLEWMGSRSKTSRLTLVITLQALEPTVVGQLYAAPVRRVDIPKASGGRDRWESQRSRIVSDKRLSADNSNRCWHRYSITIRMDIDLGVPR